MGMRNHSQRQRKSKQAPSRKSESTKLPNDGGFLRTWQQWLGDFAPTLRTRRGRKPRVPLLSLLAALVFHVMNHAGTLAEHFAMLFDDALVDSSSASPVWRRARLPWQMFAELMQRTLWPLATKRRHPSASAVLRLR